MKIIYTFEESDSVTLLLKIYITFITYLLENFKDMKKIKLIFGVLFMWIFLSSSMAQKVHTRGLITFKIKEVEVYDNSVKAAKMMKGRKIKIFFTPEKQRTELSLLGGMAEMAIISTLQDTNVVMLMKMMGQKMKMTINEQMATKMTGEHGPATDVEEPTVSFRFDDTKKILGFDTHLVDVKSTPSKGEKPIHMKFYVTNAIKTPKSVSDKIPSTVVLDGVPLEYTIDVPGKARMKYVAIDFEESFDTKVFEIPDDYQEMDPAILQGMSGN